MSLSSGRGLHPHERAARVIRLVGWIAFAFAALVFVAVLYPEIAAGQSLRLTVWAGAIVLLAIPVSLLVIARGIFAHRNWARAAGIVYGVLMLPGVPLGTLVGAYILWQLARGWPVDSPAYVGPWSKKP